MSVSRLSRGPLIKLHVQVCASMCKYVRVWASVCKCGHNYYTSGGSSLCTQGFYLLRQEVQLQVTSHGQNLFAETRMLHLCCCLHWLVLPSVHVPVVHTNGVVHSACVSEHRRDTGRVFMSALGGGHPSPPPVPGA